MCKRLPLYLICDSLFKAFKRSLSRGLSSPIVEKKKKRERRRTEPKTVRANGQRASERKTEMLGKDQTREGEILRGGRSVTRDRASDGKDGRRKRDWGKEPEERRRERQERK